MSGNRIAILLCCGLMSMALMACGDTGANSKGNSPGEDVQFEEAQPEENGNEENLSEDGGIGKSGKEDLEVLDSQSEKSQGESLEEKEPTQKSSEETGTAKDDPEKSAQGEKSQSDGYGRMLFIGDSRTVDIFSEEKDKILGEKHDDITVYCMDGAQFKFMTDSIDDIGLDGFDTLISWMGCNEFGDFSRYGPYYDDLLEKGKQLVVCTVGPTKDECLLIDVDYLYYPNANQITYNNSLKAWAEGAGVRVIDLYTFIDSTDTIYQDPQDGIHYFPKPNPELWDHILEELNSN